MHFEPACRILNINRGNARAQLQRQIGRFHFANGRIAFIARALSISLFLSLSLKWVKTPRVYRPRRESWRRIADTWCNEGRRRDAWPPFWCSLWFLRGRRYTTKIRAHQPSTHRLSMRMPMPGIGRYRRRSALSQRADNEPRKRTKPTTTGDDCSPADDGGGDVLYAGQTCSFEHLSSGRKRGSRDNANKCSRPISPWQIQTASRNGKYAALMSAYEPLEDARKNVNVTLARISTARRKNGRCALLRDYVAARIPTDLWNNFCFLDSGRFLPVELSQREKYGSSK